MRSNATGEPGRSAGSAEVAAALRHVAALASGPPLDPALRVTLHFHPDRSVNGQPLLERLTTDGVYRSQFETLTSNGGLSAHPGGDRWLWEQRLFGGAYDNSPVSSRPSTALSTIGGDQPAALPDSARHTFAWHATPWPGQRSATPTASRNRPRSATSTTWGWRP